MDELGPLRRAFSCGEGCVRPVPRVSVVASIRATRFAPHEAVFSVPRLLRRRGTPRELANTSKRGRFWFHKGDYARDGPGYEKSPVTDGGARLIVTRATGTQSKAQSTEFCTNANPI